MSKPIQKNDEHPPVPPRVRRRTIFTRKQKLGLPLIMAVPILALFGVFGETQATTRGRSKSLEVTVSFPSRLHYRQSGALTVTLVNRSEGQLDGAAVEFDTAYISRFADVRSEPEFTAAYSVSLNHILPGEHRIVVAQLAGDRYGRQPGSVTVRTGMESVRVAFSTVVFP